MGDGHLPDDFTLTFHQSDFHSMFQILTLCAPFQIADIIVVPVAIFVVDNWKIVWIGNECFGNQPVCHPVPVVAVFPQTHKFISIRIAPTIQDLGGKMFSICRDPHAGSHCTVG